MTNLDLGVFLVAGIFGATGYRREYATPIAWAIVGIWALLKLLNVVA